MAFEGQGIALDIGNREAGDSTYEDWEMVEKYKADDEIENMKQVKDEVKYRYLTQRPSTRPQGRMVVSTKRRAKWKEPQR